MITGTRYVLAVKNLEVSADFYENMLGCKTHWKADGWQLLYRDKFIVMLGECPDDRSAFETANHSYCGYVDVADIDALYEELTSKGVEIGSQLCNQPWGQREFSIRTVDGHRFTFGEALNP